MLYHDLTNIYCFTVYNLSFGAAAGLDMGLIFAKKCIKNTIFSIMFLYKIVNGLFRR